MQKKNNSKIALIKVICICLILILLSGVGVMAVTTRDEYRKNTIVKWLRNDSAYIKNKCKRNTTR